MKQVQTIKGDSPFEKTVLTPLKESEESLFGRVSGSLLVSFLPIIPLVDFLGINTVEGLMMFSGMAIGTFLLSSPLREFTRPDARNYDCLNRHELKKQPGGRKSIGNTMIQRSHDYMIPDGKTISTYDKSLEADASFKVEEAFVTIDNKVYLEQKISIMPIPLWERTFDDIMALETTMTSV